ncbi:oxoglutarate/iron-dependent dioxygenase, partial [Tanacetum coccineum]
MAKERRISGIVFIIPSPSPPPSSSDNRFTSPSSTGTEDPYGDLEKRFTSSSASAPSESSHTNTPLFSLIRVDSLSLSESIDPPRQKRLKLPSGMNLAWVLADCRNWYETALKKAPPIPDQFLSFVETALQKAQEKDSIPLMQPDICIVNFYETDDGLGLHQDCDESSDSLDKGLPVVSISIGDSAQFSYGHQKDATKEVSLNSGDVLIFGGDSRHIYHGVTKIWENTAPQSLLEKS